MEFDGDHFRCSADGPKQRELVKPRLSSNSMICGALTPLTAPRGGHATTDLGDQASSLLDNASSFLIFLYLALPELPPREEVSAL
jgi:hypothetical protein